MRYSGYKKRPSHVVTGAIDFGGESWIRTSEGVANGFTVQTEKDITSNNNKDLQSTQNAMDCPADCHPKNGDSFLPENESQPPATQQAAPDSFSERKQSPHNQEKPATPTGEVLAAAILAIDRLPLTDTVKARLVTALLAEPEQHATILPG